MNLITSYTTNKLNKIENSPDVHFQLQVKQILWSPKNSLYIKSKNKIIQIKTDNIKTKLYDNCNITLT